MINVSTQSILDIDLIMSETAIIRPCFHSEADFQFAFSETVKRIYPKSQIKLEALLQSPDRKMKIDILVELDGKVYVIELKYKTRRIDFSDVGYKFTTQNQGAQDFGRYDFLKDVERLESVQRQHGHIGFAVLLTNDLSYQNPQGSNVSFCCDFRLNEAREITGALDWIRTTITDERKSRPPFILAGRYKIKWADYSSVDGTYGHFKYLALKVD